MAKMSLKQFEKSGKDKDTKGIKEGSKKDLALDKKQLSKINKGRK
jgi:hypothetical protein